MPHWAAWIDIGLALLACLILSWRLARDYWRHWDAMSEEERSEERRREAW